MTTKSGKKSGKKGSDEPEKKPLAAKSHANDKGIFTGHRALGKLITYNF